MSTVEVCLSPALIHNFDMQQKTVVVVDVIRATSIVCSALENGVLHVLPLPTKDETRTKKEDGYLILGEKDGNKLEGFDLMNSPSAFVDHRFGGRKIAMSTTNGTKALFMAQDAADLVMGSFLNIDALAQWLGEQQRDTLIFCAGWKDRLNIEDTLFAGNLSSLLQERYKYESMNDEVTLAQVLYRQYGHDMYRAVMQSSQRERILAQHLEVDVQFCLQRNYTQIVPILQGSILVSNLS